MQLTIQSKTVAAALVTVLGAFAWGHSISLPSEVTEFWNASNESNESSIDHSKWQEILDRFVQEHESGINRFDYVGLKEDGELNQSLIEYLLELSEVDPRNYSKSEQLAYWLNHYNAIAVYLVTSQFPVESIQKIRFEGPDTSPLDMKLAYLQDQPLSMNDIRNEILRPIWQDNRIHFALNSASLGCPSLSKQAFNSDNVDELLDAGMNSYLNHTRGVSIQEGKLTVSSIFEWYMDDFGHDGDEILAYLMRHVPTDLSEQIGELSKYETAYDWQVNSP